jgi:starch synthase
VKEPTPDAEQVERFSQGQGADPSRRRDGELLKEPTLGVPEDVAAVEPSPSAPARSRNPLAQLLRRSEG